MKPDKNLTEMTKSKFKKLLRTHTQTDLAAMLGVSQPDISYWARKFWPSRSNGKKLRITDSK